MNKDSRISIQLKRWEQALKMDKALKGRVHHIEGILVGLRQKTKEGSNLSFEGLTPISLLRADPDLAGGRWGEK